MAQQQQDWHRADIIAALHKKNIKLAALSRQAGLSDATLANTFYRPWPKGEKLIAEALDMDPAEIWPSRYHDEAGNRLLRTLKNHQKPISN
ncbi:DNA-binding protein [Pectobacterium carotovorum subsp. carotovorum]|nr:DNA-binding protein [Pectobacterium carotovorum subsp. carotovorum]